MTDPLRISDDGCEVEFSLRPNNVILPVQTHTCNVAIVKDLDDTYPDTDALVCLKPGVAIGVRTADCVPVLLYAPDINAVAAIHAGWKGTYGDIAGNTIRVLCEYGADPAMIKVWFGPCVCADCYQVDEQFAGKFAKEGFQCAIHTERVTGRPHVDLAMINRLRLLSNGVKEENIRMPGYCTCHSKDSDGRPLFPSWRRDHGTDIRLVSRIRLTDKKV